MPLDPNRPLPKRPRLKNVDSYQGARGYFITLACYDRRKYFIKSETVNLMTQFLEKVSAKEGFDIVVYCFMPDHLHLVLTGRNEKSGLQNFVKNFKQSTGFYFKKISNKFLWAKSYHDHVLRESEDIKSVGRYTLQNPVGAGLVKNVLDYPFSGSFVYDLEELVQSDPFVDMKSI